MGLERRLKNLFQSILKQQICGRKELNEVFEKLTLATNKSDPLLCPPKVFIRQNFDKELPSSLYLALVRVNALKPFADDHGIILGFAWNSSVSSQTALPYMKIPQACKSPSTGLFDPKYSETIKNSLKVLQNHKELIINRINKVHDINYVNNLQKESDVEWPLLDVLSEFKSNELGVTFNFAHLFKDTFPEYQNKEINNMLINLPNSLYLELVHRSFLMEVKAYGWQIQFTKTLFNPIVNNAQRKVLLKIGVI